jgi:hypothetical protein
VTVNFTGMPGNPYDWVAISVAGDPDTSYVEWKFIDGQQTGSRTLAGLSAGSYEARAYVDNSFTIVATSTFTVTSVAPPPTPTVVTDQQTYQPNSTVTVTYTNMPGNTYDWVGISTAGSPDTDYLAYSYTVGQTDGTAAFSGLPGGSYEARAYLNNSYTVLSRYAFTITSAPSVSTSPTYVAGDAITVGFAALPGNAYDWVAVCAAGAPDMSYIQWKYTNGEVTGSRSFAGLAAGNYEARAYVNNTFTRIATSTFTVTTGTPPPPPSVTTDQATYAAGQPINLSFMDLPGNVYDWVAISVAGSPDTSYIQWKFTNGQATGTKQFGGLPAGSYEARAYVNNSFTRIATSTFDVTP